MMVVDLGTSFVATVHAILIYLPVVLLNATNRSSGLKSAVVSSISKSGSTALHISPSLPGYIRSACLYVVLCAHSTFLIQTDASKLPTIIKEMGIANNANQVQLWSVIPFAIATPFTGE